MRCSRRMGSARFRAERARAPPRVDGKLLGTSIKLTGDGVIEADRTPEEEEVILRNTVAPAATALALIAAPAHAGPCTDRIYAADLAVEKLLDAAAANGAPAPQSSFATMHRQPTL